MFRFKPGLLFLLIVSIGLFFIFSFHNISGEISYFNSSTIPLPADTTNLYLIEEEDEEGLSYDTLFQEMSKEGYPVRYFRRIRTGVCFDNKCRLLDIVLYWNVTGRYLGFRLPENEFLSKHDHEPFTKAEYERLHTLLADFSSPLGNFSYNEIAPNSNPEELDVDGVSSATSKNVLEFVVEGAAYTTYKLWHLIYGPTQTEVMNLTQNEFSSGFMLKILESEDISDKVWGLGRIRNNLELTPELMDKVVDFIEEDNYSLSEAAIHAIAAHELKDGDLQVMLVEKLPQINFSLKKPIIDKLKQAPDLDPRVRKNLSQQLHDLGDATLSSVVDLFEKHQVNDLATCMAIAELLKNENNFISGKAFRFLEKAGIQDESIQKLLHAYKSGQN